MKHSFMILLASMLLVFSLTACGRNDKNNAQTSNDPPTTNQETVPDNQNSGTENDAMMGDSQNDENRIPNDTVNPPENSAMDESTPNDTIGQDVGVSYEQMLRNGRVHDTDGLLHDGENAVTNIGRDVKDAAKDVVRSTRTTVNNMMR